MPVSICMEISDSPTPDIVYSFRNFGKDIFHILKNGCAVSIDEINQASTYFDIPDIKNRAIGNITTVINARLNHHNFSKSVSLIRL